MTGDEGTVEPGVGKTDAGPSGAAQTRAEQVATGDLGKGHFADRHLDSGQTESVRVDSWVWSVRLAKTRSMAAAACRAGHVRVNDERVKPAQMIRVGDRVRVRQENWERIVVVSRVVRKRVGAVVAVECYIDHSPPPPTRESIALAGERDRGSGRPTKRERRDLDRLRGR